jgi:hypothetical protein
LRNYFNYYTEIEEHFQRRRGTLLMLSTLDWALISAWQEAGYPLEAVLTGIDAAFDKHATRHKRAGARRINGLAYCAQAVTQAVEAMHEAAVGAAAPSKPARETGFEPARIAQYLRAVAAELETCSTLPELVPSLQTAAARMRELAAEAEAETAGAETLEQHLLSQEDQIFAAMQAAVPAEEFAELRSQAARELAPHRSRMQAVQIRQIEQQFLRRSMFQRYAMPRLSLFYMPPA